MTVARRLAHSSRVLVPGSGVSWRVGPVDQPDTLRTGVILRRDPDGVHVWVRPDDATSEVRMPLELLAGAFRMPPLTRGREELTPAMELPAPVSRSLELLELLDQGVEVEAGQYTVLRGVLDELVRLGYLVARPGGRWDLTDRGREVLRG